VLVFARLLSTIDYILTIRDLHCLWLSASLHRKRFVPFGIGGFHVSNECPSKSFVRKPVQLQHAQRK
jgi:hypothetical protein